MRLLTVGHGALPAEDFAALLVEAGVARIVDVRRYPGSRRNPQYNRGELEQWLPEAGIAYRWEERLGGRRSPAEDSPHLGLREPQFRAYADHMADEDFHAALREVLEEAADGPTAVICAESVWWRCHRRLIADAASLLHDTDVRHLFHDGRSAPHAPTDAARVVREHDDVDVLVYDVGENLRLPEG